MLDATNHRDWIVRRLPAIFLPRERFLKAMPVRRAAVVGKTKNKKAGGRPARKIALGPLEGHVAFYLRRAQESSGHALSLRTIGISAFPIYFTLLSLIDSNPGMSLTMLARATRRDITSVTAAVEILVHRRLVIRERLESDRRTYAVTLTASGKRLLRKLMKEANERERIITHALGTDREAFVSALKRIAAAFGSDDEIYS
jgi:DNA-binding MarR family transcriptional regulator